MQGPIKSESVTEATSNDREKGNSVPDTNVRQKSMGQNEERQ